MINEQDLMANIDKSRVMAQAKTMLDQNIPIETISNQLGLDRNTLNNLLMQNSLMPESVMQPDDYRNSYGAGITGNQLNDPTTQVIIDGMTSGEGEGADIKEFLDVNLGANTGEDDDLTTDQAITSGSVAGVMGDQDSFMSYLEGASMLEGLTDPEKMEIYKRAATDMVGEMDYDEFIQQPDKVMPYLAAGLSLINSGEKGEDWGAALGKAFISGYGSKRKEEREFEKTKASIGIKKQENVNNLVGQFVMLDYKNKVALNKSLMQSNLEKPLMVDISNDGSFTDKETIPMSEASYAFMARQYPNMVRESVNSNKEAWTVVDKTGGMVNVLYDQDQVNNWDPMKNDGAVLRKGHDEQTNIKRYLRKDADGNTLNEALLSPEQARYQMDNLGYELTEASTSGTMRWVLDKDGKGLFVSQADIQKNPTAYKDDSGMSLIMNSDGSFTYSTGSAGMKRSREKAGRDFFEESISSVDGVQQAYTNYFTASLEQDKMLKAFVDANPDAMDLPFNNITGRALRGLDSLRVGIQGLGAVFSKPYEEGGYKFSIVNDNGDRKEADFDEFKESVMTSVAFTDALKSPFAKFLEDIGIASEGVKNTMFDLAMVGAATYGPQKGGGLDLRAMSDKDVMFQMGVQGGNAYSLAGFLDTRNRFARNLIKKNRNFIKRTILPSKISMLIDENGDVKQSYVDGLTGDVESALKELDEYEKLYTESYAFGFQGESSNVAPAYLVGVKDPDEDNPNVIELNVSISPETGVIINGENAPQFQRVIQQFGITSPIDSNTNTVNGTYRDMTQKYINFGKTNQQKQNEYYNMLQKTLSQSEFAVLNMHILTTQKQSN